MANVSREEGLVGAVYAIPALIALNFARRLSAEALILKPRTG
jgi:hypothetical protein